MAAQTFNTKTIHIIDDLDHKALVIENACTQQEADNLEIGSWGKNGYTITVDPQEGFIPTQARKLLPLSAIGHVGRR